MHYVHFYITPEDILNRLSEEDKKKGFNTCMPIEVQRWDNGEIEIKCVLLKDEEEIYDTGYRQKLFND